MIIWRKFIHTTVQEMLIFLQLFCSIWLFEKKNVVYYAYAYATTQFKYTSGLKYTGNCLLFRYERFINYLTSVLRHEERHTILTMLAMLSDTTNVQRLWYLSVEIRKIPITSSTVENTILYAPLTETQWSNLKSSTAWSDSNFDCLHTVGLSASMADNPTVCSTINSKLPLFQNLQILRTITSEHDVIHTQPHFLSGVYYDNCDCHILCVRAYTVPNAMHLD